MKFAILFIVLILNAIAFACEKQILTSYYIPTSRVTLKFQKNDNTVECLVIRGVTTIQRINLDSTFTENQIQRTDNGFTLSANDKTITYEVIADKSDFCLVKVSRKINGNEKSQDCFNLDIGHTSWYGGPENRYQYWPVEKASFKDYSFVSKEQDNCAITERYWLNSKGMFIFIDEIAPLFINQNTDDHPNQICFAVQRKLPYDTRIEQYDFTYYIGASSNPRKAHMKALEYNILKKPTGYPDEEMVRHPIWSTWAKYKAPINESIVRDFANQIVGHKFKNSQLEIDDDWEECYGALTFNKAKFPDIRKLTDDLHAQGFRVTLWIHPFINKNCTKWYNEAKDKGYLVTDHNGSTDTRWWNSDKDGAAYIDFTNSDAAKWYTQRLETLNKTYGIDSFKFDAGESSWSPADAKFHTNGIQNPSLITSAYVRTVAKFGPIVEVRSGQSTQDLAIFLRMIDKDTEWGWNNGLLTLVTTLLQLNMVGYPFVLPDMIGGNGYNNKPPKKEIFLRWLQANVFMPSLQYSYVPWDFDEDEETINISLKFTEMHANITDQIMKRFKLAVETGEPVNPPLWWIAPDDIVALQIYDQYLLGEDVIVAPILKENQVERDVYLPKGVWKDGNSEQIYHGPRWVMNYPAPIDILPYFTRVYAII